MPLVADDAADRAGQLIAVTRRLEALVRAETRLIENAQPLPDGPEAEEKARLVNLYRQEMARIAQTPTLLVAAPARLREELKTATASFQDALAVHERTLVAVKTVTEGLVQSIAEALAKARSGPERYTAAGGYAGARPAGAAAVNRQA